jgi:hypothetical protein
LSEIPPALVEDASLRRGPDRLPPPKAVQPDRAARPFGAPTGTRIQPTDIPGVKRGATAFVPSAARAEPAQSLFQPGDRVRHGRLGEGVVSALRGAGRDAIVVIKFIDGSEKSFKADVAPIIKIG